MKTYRIAVLGGDGIGPEVIREGMKVLRAAAELHGFGIDATEYPHGTEHYLQTGELFPDSVRDEMAAHDAIYLGAIGDPRVERGLVEKGVIMGLRFGLDLYVNLRPIKLYSENLCPLKGKKPADIDFVVVRENTEGAYAMCNSFFKKGTPEEVALQEMVYTRKGVERVIRYAFDYCRKRDQKKRLTLVDKANALQSHDLWRRVFEEVGREYSDIELDVSYVDATAMWFITKPDWFDVIVTPNLFGDILTDLGSTFMGGLGLAASGNVHPGKIGMYEPIHGSAPKYTGKNVANPLATIMAGKMLLEDLGEVEAANAIETSVAGLLSSGRINDLSARSGLKTDEIGDMVVGELE